jgi:endonuclease/exonuclease/phosphatase family metal-dependent hydrolase
MQDVRKTRRRIDFAFADESAARRTRSARVDIDDTRVGQWSDHYPILVEVDG